MPYDIIKPLYGAINVPLTIFWSEPHEEPIYKNISSQAATNPAAWSGSLTIEERLWLVDKVDTTAIFGERVVILDQQGDWLKVAAVSQHTPKNEQGYPGWVLTNQVCRNPTYLTEQFNLPETIVSVPKATLFSDSALTQTLDTLSYQTRLPILAENECFFQSTPTGWQFGLPFTP